MFAPLPQLVRGVVNMPQAVGIEPADGTCMGMQIHMTPDCTWTKAKRREERMGNFCSSSKISVFLKTIPYPTPAPPFQGWQRNSKTPLICLLGGRAARRGGGDNAANCAGLSSSGIAVIAQDYAGSGSCASGYNYHSEKT